MGQQITRACADYIAGVYEAIPAHVAIHVYVGRQGENEPAKRAGEGRTFAASARTDEPRAYSSDGYVVTVKLRAVVNSRVREWSHRETSTVLEAYAGNLRQLGVALGAKGVGELGL